MNGVKDDTWLGVMRPAMAEARAEFLRLLRQPAYVVPTLLFPLFFYLVFGVMFAGHSGTGTYVFATFATYATISPALYGFGIGFALERHSGSLELKRTTPMPAFAPFTAKLVASICFALIVFAELAVTAAAARGVHLGLDQWLGLVAVCAAGSVPFGALGLALATVARPRAAVALVNAIFMPMVLLSGLWVPLFLFPKMLQQLAVVWPAYHMGRLALAVVGRAGGNHAWIHVAVLAGFTLLCLAFATRRLRRSEAISGV